MYIKLFPNKKGGSIASLNYLLNHREQDGTAKILKGDRNLTENIIKSISNKQKVTVGALSFEEQSLTAVQQEELMKEFENTLFPGLSEDQYNILWVLHTDKNRQELNFVVPKVELSTKKALNPYYHKYDFPRIEMFEDIYNTKFNLTSKKDPRKSQTIRGSKKEIHLFKNYERLDVQLHQLVQSGSIKNREHMIELLKESGIEVIRASKEYISIKLPKNKRAKRFNGGIYNEQFTSIEQIATISEEAERRIREWLERDIQGELEKNIKRLEQYNEQKAQQNRAKYSQRSKEVPRLESFNDSSNKLSSSGNNSRRKDRELHSHKNRDGEINDFRRRTLERERERAITLKETRKPKINRSEGIRTELERNSREVRAELDGHQARAYKHIEQDSKPIYDKAKRVVQERNRQRERTRQRERAIKILSSTTSDARKRYRDQFERFRRKTSRPYEYIIEESSHLIETIQEFTTVLELKVEKQTKELIQENNEEGEEPQSYLKP